MRFAALRRAAALASLPLLISGCDLLAAAMLDPYAFDPLAPDPFGEPAMSSAYDAGTAVVELDERDAQQTVVLNEVVEGSELWEYGATITWRNDEGWAMTVSTYSDTGFGSTNDVVFQRINGNELWVTDYLDTMNRCIVSVIELSEERVSGSVECDTLRWVDGLGAPSYSDTRRFIEGQGPFHVHVEFEATADASLNS